MHLIVYKKNSTNHLPGYDALGRRLFPLTRHIRTLCLSSDGRLAYGISSKVTILSPLLVLQAVGAWKGVGTQKHVSSLDMALSDNSQRLNRHLRTPVVGLEIVFAADKDDSGLRKEMDNALLDVTGVAWTEYGSVLINTGSGACFAVRPKFESKHAGEDGTWGSLLEMWERTSVGTFGVSLSTSRKNQSSNAKKQAKKESDEDFDMIEVVDRNQHIKENSRVSCIEYVCVHTQSSTETLENNKQLGFVACGSHSGVKFYAGSTWENISTCAKCELRIDCGYVMEIKSFDGVKSQNKLITLIAIAHTYNVLEIYGVWIEECEETEYSLQSQRLWHLDDVIIPGSINFMSWSSNFEQLSLAVAIGNGVAIIKWVMKQSAIVQVYEWNDPVIHIVDDAHNQLVTSVELLVDGSFVSSSLDGRITHWEHTGTTSDTAAFAGNLDYIDSTVVHHDRNRREPVMSMVATTNGFGFLAVTTMSKGSGEVRDTEAAVLEKFKASGRKSIISMYSMPWFGDASTVAQTIINKFSRHIEEYRYIRSPIVTWDIEHYIDQQDDGDDSISKELNKHANLMLTILKRKEESCIKHYQRCRVFVALCKIILDREKSKEVEWVKNIMKECSQVRDSLLCDRYYQNMKSFFNKGIQMNELNLEERQSLENMCQFMSICKEEYLLNINDTKEQIRKVREKLGPFIASSEMFTIICPICAPGVNVPLVSNATEPSCFHCFSGDPFIRCVQTGLPCVDAVHLLCSNCDAHGRRLSGSNENSYHGFKWLHNIMCCPICQSSLLLGHGYPL